ncbi:hypothetical protein PO587_38905 [Streptomyces gilvifuscus]|uniref:Uncharacterized protein n=1 Tax=Streptomyces gilvifuscus TaxID=1550617 RepID=A0ABT5G6J2_9ACTN|nr:hypothetical protein [Streptomyces gilvifuscus]MDC2960410.1 hypothetical protein [Streptomyces gilvifuscus]
MLTSVVQALVDTGSVERAHGLVARGPADADAGCVDRLHQAIEHVRRQLDEGITRLDMEDFLTVLVLNAQEQRDDARSTLMSWEENLYLLPWGGAERGHCHRPRCLRQP